MDYVKRWRLRRVEIEKEGMKKWRWAVLLQRGRAVAGGQTRSTNTKLIGISRAELKTK